MSRRAAAAIAFLIGCSGPRTSDPEAESVLRVSAAAGLSDLTPRPLVSGSSAQAMDLVFDLPDSHIESMRADGSRVILSRRPSTRFSADELARALRYEGLISAHALDAQHIEARFIDEKTAALCVQYQNLGFDIGPFAIDSQAAGRIRLVRRGDSAIDVIELVESSRSDEWRKLVAHELDVVPWAASVYRAEFGGMASIRILDIPPNDTAAIYFNVRAPTLADPRVRRHLAALIRRPALARLACGDASCASPDVEATSDAPLPPRLSVIVPKDFTTLLTAAKILRHQLFQAGVELDIEPISVEEYVDRTPRGDYLLALGPLTVADHRFGFFLSPSHPKAFAMTGFASAEYDGAVDRGDLVTAQAVLDRELPVTRLFELRSFAAVDAGFCGDVTPTSSSWLWLKELYPCER